MKFKQSITQFFQSKTNWTGITAILGAIISYNIGIIDTAVCVQTIMGGLGMIFIRDAIAGN